MLVIIDTGVANIASVKFACERIGINPVISDDPVVIKRADRVILPGVGNASAGMRELRRKKLDKLIPMLKQPLLGICLGMHLLFEFSEEENVKCLGIIPGKVEKLKADNLVVPHMGWNKVSINKKCALAEGLSDDYAYFVHSYAVKILDSTIASCDYGEKFSAVCQWKNFYGVQFHPERSGEFGEKLLRNFMRIKV